MTAPLRFDALGFALPALSAAEAAARAALTQARAARAHKWASKNVPLDVGTAADAAVSSSYHALLFDPSLKTLVRQGIPQELRPTLWYWLSGGYTLRCASPPHLYTKLASSTDTLDDAAIVAIEEGLHTKLDPIFRTCILFQTSKGPEALSRIMFAALQHRPDLTYSRSLHQLAAFMLVVMGIKNEQQVFWTLIGALQNKIFPAVNGQVQLGSFVEQGVLELLVHKKLPRVVLHLAKAGWELSGITSGWFAGVFTSQLPPETAARVWDSVLLEGNKVMHRVALALVKRHETVILGCSQLQVMRKILDLRISGIIDDDELMTTAFRGIGSMPGAMLAGYRQHVTAGAPYHHFSAAHAAASALQLDRTPVGSGAGLVQSGSTRGWLGRSLSRVSNNSYHGVGATHGAKDSAAGSSQATSECGYNSDGGQSQAQRRVTASSRPQNVQFA